MTLAHELHMSLDRCMKEHTWRQYRLWIKWLDKQWNRPSRTDKYLMAIACEVRRVLAKDPNKYQVEDFKLQFKEPPPTPVSTKYSTTNNPSTNYGDSNKESTDNSQYNDKNQGNQGSNPPYTFSQKAVADIAKARWFGMMTLPIEGVK